MEHASAPPASVLRPFVASYVGYRQRGDAPGTHRGLPSPWLTLILTLDEPLTVLAHPDPAQPGGDYETLLAGLHTTPALLAHPGHQSGVQVSLRPLGARALLGLPAGELAGCDVPAGDILGSDADELRTRLLATRCWSTRFAAIDAVLTRRLVAAHDAPAPEVARAWSLITCSGGRTTVASLAADVGWGERRLHQRLTAELGVGPKTALRLVRFHTTRTALAGRVAAGAAPDLAGLAATYGYADQSHLTREFRALAGLAPHRWLAAEHQVLAAADSSKTTPERPEHPERHDEPQPRPRRLAHPARP